MNINVRNFGHLPDGHAVDLIELHNDNQMVVKITNYGGIITSWKVPDKNGISREIVLGFDNLQQFLDDTSYMGAIVGRYANRIRNSCFTLNGTEYPLYANEGKNHLHGGKTGFNKVLWKYEMIDSTDDVGIKLSYLGRDMEEGYPGNLHTEVMYLLNNRNELIIRYIATSDKPTHINLTNHAYFNLSGGKKNIFSHILTLNAGKYTVSDEENIPTGEIRSTEGTNFDFRTPVAIGDRILNIPTGGYDNNYVIDKKEGELAFAAEVLEPENGLKMEVFTTEPGIQLYSAIHFDGSVKGHEGVVYHKYYGYCLETQHFADSPNQQHFPSTLLNPGDEYTQETIYRVTAVHQ